MQVNNVQSSQNFGMALRIDKGGAEYLAKQSEKVLTRLGEIGGEMKDYKHWDLLVTEKGYEVVQKGTALPRRYATFVDIHEAGVNKYSDNSLQFDTYIGGSYANSGSKVTQLFENLDPSEVENVKKNFSEYAYNSPDRFAELVRFLERRSAEEAAEKAAKEAQERKINELVDDLVSRFSVDA